MFPAFPAITDRKWSQRNGPNEYHDYRIT